MNDYYYYFNFSFTVKEKKCYYAQRQTIFTDTGATQHAENKMK